MLKKPKKVLNYVYSNTLPAWQQQSWAFPTLQAPRQQLRSEMAGRTSEGGDIRTPCSCSSHTGQLGKHRSPAGVLEQH